MYYSWHSSCQGAGRELRAQENARGSMEGDEGTCVVPSSGEVCGRNRSIVTGGREKWYPKKFLLM